MATAAAVSPSFYPLDSQVLLSYEERAKDFVSHLRAALTLQGIPTRSLMEEPETEQRTRLIQQSKFSIVVLSAGYAKSERHMNELVKIIDENETNGQLVMPVFYHVATNDVENLEGEIGKAFMPLADSFHEANEFDDAKNEFLLDESDGGDEEEEFWDVNEFLTPWERALYKAGFLTGRVVSPEQHESFRVDLIVSDVSKWRTHLRIPSSKGDFGIDRRMAALEATVLRNDDDGDICGVGVCGMGGDGKSTVMRRVLDKMQGRFDGCRLIQDGENDVINGELHRLNDTLGGGKEKGKVLIALDGVERYEKVEHLLTRCGWIGSGSRIVVTTRDEDTIDMVAGKEIKVGQNDHKISWQLHHKVESFSDKEADDFIVQIAFGGSVLPDDLKQVLQKVVSYAQGNPFALTALCRGGHQRNTSAKVWQSMVDKLDRVANRDIQARMRTSYDSLLEEQQEIFLDVASFFEGETVDYTVWMLEACYPYDDIKDELGCLKKKSLIAIDDRGVIGIHSLHRSMAKDIVREEVRSPGGDARRPRMLWNHDDVRRVLPDSPVSGSIRGICLDICKAKKMNLPSDAFVGMSDLKFLKFHVSSSCCPPCGEQQHYKVHASQASIRLPDELMLLHWHRYPLASLHSQFNPHNLVEIHLVRSSLERLWEGTKGLPRLKRINLSNSKRFAEMPDLSQAPELETITLVSCVSLLRLHSSINGLTKLKELNLKHCEKVENLPSLADLGCLETLDLAGCSSLTQLPQMPPNLQNFNPPET